MRDFEFYNPTKIIFGRDRIDEIGYFVNSMGKRALLVYGRGSIKKIGVYDRVVSSLRSNGVEIVEHPGVKPNPVLSHTREGIDIAKREGVQVIVAVGGGSVIDESKAIAFGVLADRDVWDFFLDKVVVERALPLAVVLTVAATASEMNGNTVITNDETKQKLYVKSPLLFPKISIMDPSVTYSVGREYSVYGAVDIISHVLESYLTQEDKYTPITDGFSEHLVRVVMSSVEKILRNPKDYEARASMMWASTLALNGICTTGVGKYEFPNHMIEHTLSAMYDVAHGAGLAVVLPAWMQYQVNSGCCIDRFVLFAERVFGVVSGSASFRARLGVVALKSWFKEVGAPVSLEELGIPVSDIDKIAEGICNSAFKWGLDKKYSKGMVRDILHLAV